jgi:ribosomal protein S6
MEQKNKNYELSFWFSSRLSEEEIEKKFDNLLKQLEKREALIIFSQSPQLKQLAYPIKKERNAYFGYIQFELPKDLLVHLEEDLRLNDDFVRFMVLGIKPKEKQKAPSITFRKPIKKEEEKEEEKSKTQEATKKEPQKEKVISLEELDKKLNEILEEE